MKGTELNQASGSYEYSAIAIYVVIFWEKGEASVIEMNFPMLTAVPMDGIDQQGRKWEVAKSDYCYY